MMIRAHKIEKRSVDLLDVRKVWQRQQDAVTPAAPRGTPIPKPPAPILDFSVFQSSVEASIMHDHQRVDNGLKPMDLYIKSNPGLLGGVDATNPRDWHHSVTKTQIMSTFVDNYNTLRNNVLDKQKGMALLVTLPSLKGVEHMNGSVTNNDFVKSSKSNWQGKTHLGINRAGPNKRKRTKSNEKRALPPIASDSQMAGVNKSSVFLTETSVTNPPNLQAKSDTYLPQLKHSNHSINDNGLKVSGSANDLDVLNGMPDMIKIREKIQEASKKAPMNYDVPLPGPTKQLNPISDRYKELRITAKERKYNRPAETVEQGEQYKMKQKSLLKLKMSETDIIEIVRDNQLRHHTDMTSNVYDSPDWSKVPSKLASLTRPSKKRNRPVDVLLKGSEQAIAHPVETLHIESQTAPSIIKGEESRNMSHNSCGDSESGNTNVGRYIYRTPREPGHIADVKAEKKIAAVNITIPSSRPKKSKSSQLKKVRVLTDKKTIDGAADAMVDDQSSVFSDARSKLTMSQVSSDTSKRTGAKQKTVFKKFRKLEIFENKNKTLQEEDEDNCGCDDAKEPLEGQHKRYLPLTRPPRYKLADAKTYVPENYMGSDIDQYSDVYIGLCECMLCSECKGIQQELLSATEGHVMANPPNSEASQPRMNRRASDDSNSLQTLERSKRGSPVSKGASKAPSAKTITESEQENESESHAGSSTDLEVPPAQSSTNAQEERDSDGLDNSKTGIVKIDSTVSPSAQTIASDVEKCVTPENDETQQSHGT